MSWTLAQLQRQVIHALHGSLPAEQLHITNIVNEAGNYLFSMHDWRFRNSGEVTVDMKAGKSYIDLPADFGHPIQATINGFTTSFEFTTFRHIAELRSGAPLTSSIHFWGCVVWPPRDKKLAHWQKTRPLPPRIELYPEIGDDGEIQVWYRRRWTDLFDLEDIADIPWYAEQLLIDLVRATATGYDLDYEGSRAERFTEILNGPVFAAATREDGRLQPHFGVVCNGAVEYASRPRFDIFDGATISDPA